MSISKFTWTFPVEFFEPNITGDSAVAISPAADLSIERTIQGDSSVVLSPAAQLVEGRGIDGAVTISAVPAAQLSIDNTISGDSSIVVSPESEFQIERVFDGQSNIAISPNAPVLIYARNYSFNADSSIDLLPEAVDLIYSKNYFITGTVSFEFNILGNMIEGRAIQGASSIKFIPDSNPDHTLNAAFVGASQIFISAESQIENSFDFIADGKVSVSAGSLLDYTFTRSFEGDSSFFFTPFASLIEGRGISGHSSILTTPEATVLKFNKKLFLSGESEINFQIQSVVDFDLRAEISGDSSIVISPTAQLIEGRGIDGASTISITAEATLLEYARNYFITGQSGISAAIAADLNFTFRPQIEADGQITFTASAAFQFSDLVPLSAVDGATIQTATQRINIQSLTENIDRMSFGSMTDIFSETHFIDQVSLTEQIDGISITSLVDLISETEMIGQTSSTEKLSKKSITSLTDFLSKTEVIDENSTTEMVKLS